MVIPTIAFQGTFKYTRLESKCGRSGHESTQNSNSGAPGCDEPGGRKPINDGMELRQGSAAAPAAPSAAESVERTEIDPVAAASTAASDATDTATAAAAGADDIATADNAIDPTQDPPPAPFRDTFWDEEDEHSALSPPCRRRGDPRYLHDNAHQEDSTELPEPFEAGLDVGDDGKSFKAFRVLH